MVIRKAFLQRLFKSVFAFYLLIGLLINSQLLLASLNTGYKYSILLQAFLNFFYLLLINLELEFVDYLYIFRPTKKFKLGYLTLKHKRSYKNMVMVYFLMLAVMKFSFRQFSFLKDIQLDYFTFAAVTAWVFILPLYIEHRFFIKKNIEKSIDKNKIQVITLTLSISRAALLYLFVYQFNYIFAIAYFIQMLLSYWLFSSFSMTYRK